MAGRTPKYDAQSAGSGGKNSVALTVISPFLAIRSPPPPTPPPHPSPIPPPPTTHTPPSHPPT
ncbi:hypothetical protein PV939_10630, partial [Ligilactobacillus salivarius]|nr:hypothetical protein [Ligilactobacillus salivarius]